MVKEEQEVGFTGTTFCEKGFLSQIPVAFIVYSHQSSGQGNCKSRGQNNQPSSLGLIRVEQEAKAIRLCRNTFPDVFLLW